MSICMSIIREHGGNLDAKALPGGGSVFTVELPVLSLTGLGAAEIAPAAGMAATVCPGSNNLNALQGRSVLVVDDEESIRSLLEEGLSAHQLHVDCAENAEAAIAFAENRSYDVLLCDLNLSRAGGGKVSGREAADRILAAAGLDKPSVVFMTGELVDPGDNPPGSNEPRLLQKPFRISDVLMLIQEVCLAKVLKS